MVFCVRNPKSRCTFWAATFECSHRIGKRGSVAINLTFSGVAVLITSVAKWKDCVVGTIVAIQSYINKTAWFFCGHHVYSPVL